MKNTYLILIFAAFSFWNESANAQAYACCNSDATACAAGDGQICCSYVTSGSPYTSPYCGNSEPGSSDKTGDFEQNLPKNTCNNTNDYDRLCQKSAPPQEVTPQKLP